MNNRQKSSNKSSAMGSIRLIAGKHRGRKLPVLMADGLRPTTDRVKETVFNWLMAYMQDSHCLDCFAGAGSLGFEAYSRGAKRVTMIELNKTAANQLQLNKQSLEAKNVTIHHADTLKFLTKPTQQFDIVFIDPPFRQGIVEQVIKQINHGWLHEGALIYIETEAEHSLNNLPDNWQLRKEKIAGQVAYRLFQVVP